MGRKGVQAIETFPSTFLSLQIVFVIIKPYVKKTTAMLKLQTNKQIIIIKSLNNGKEMLWF